MISTQLDLFGGPPKPPKNIREEEPPIVAQPSLEKPVEPEIQPDPEILDGSSDGPVLDNEKEHFLEELPEWIIEPTPEADIEIEEVTAAEPHPNGIGDSIDEHVPEIEDATEPEPDFETVDSTFEEPTPSIENATEPESDPDSIEGNETTLEVEILQDKENDAEETLTASIPEDTVHVQLPTHHASPVIFTSLIPVDSFVVEENNVTDAAEIQPENDDKGDVNEIELPVLGSDAVEKDMQDEEPPSPPFLGEDITTDDVITGGETDVDSDDANTEDVQETKEGQLQIPEDEKLFLRQYYTMRETSNMFGVNQSLLRYWENEFDVLKPKKNRKGDRYFRPEDIKNLELIYHLLKVRKFTIEGAREYIKSKKKVLDTFELVQRLEKLKGFLHELKTHL